MFGLHLPDWCMKGNDPTFLKKNGAQQNARIYSAILKQKNQAESVRNHKDSGPCFNCRDSMSPVVVLTDLHITGVYFVAARPCFLT